MTDRTQVSKLAPEAKRPHESATTEQPSKPSLPKRAFELDELTEQGYGSRSFLYQEISARRLRALKRGRRTVVLVEDLEAWLQQLPKAKIAMKRKAA